MDNHPIQGEIQILLAALNDKLLLCFMQTCPLIKLYKPWIKEVFVTQTFLQRFDEAFNQDHEICSILGM